MDNNNVHEKHYEQVLSIGLLQEVDSENIVSAWIPIILVQHDEFS